MNKPIIMCVDDEETVLDSLRRQLSEELEDDFDIETAISGGEALDLVAELLEENCEIAVVISDYIMPDLKGDEVLRKIHQVSPQTLKIMLTGQAKIEGITNAINSAKLYRYIAKPWETEDLSLTIKEAVKSYLQSQQLEKQNAQLQQLNHDQAKLIKQLKESESHLTQLVAGVAHEMNSPLAAIRSSADNSLYFFREILSQLPDFFQELPPQYHFVVLSLLKIATQQNNIFSLSSREKRSLKRELVKQLKEHKISDASSKANILIGIGIYDEWEFTLPILKDDNCQKILNTIYDLTSLYRNTKTIVKATELTNKIVFVLKTYADYERSSEKLLVDLTEGIEAVLESQQTRFKQGIEVSKSYQSIPKISCCPDEIKQMWLNLIYNAIQAMKNKGNLGIEIRPQNNYVAIKITDSGCGIPAETKEKIFQPFFTTKSPGEGSGLGLSIVRKIIDKHQGKISVESQPGKTTFSVFLPMEEVRG
ncbi:MAG: ATP-binding protein [Spirulinaceae cyanobacterium]